MEEKNKMFEFGECDVGDVFDLFMFDFLLQLGKFVFFDFLFGLFFRFLNVRCF